ncbi:MAG TPA: Holliday junction resolvase RuvX [Rubrobacteraceae bacterium]|nr:Holliday junction resolvase RuvX [Rubrobacteraceae bacterium]
MVPSGCYGRVAALDIGEVHTGVAVSDPGGSLARPLEVVPSEHLAEYLRVLLAEEAVTEIVVGVPKTLGGEVGFQAKQVLDKLDALRNMFPSVRFVEWDERLTTRMARSSRSGSRPKDRRSRRKRGAKERLDHLAAAGMLQEYLDRRGALEAIRQSS